MILLNNMASSILKMAAISLMLIPSIGATSNGVSTENTTNASLPIAGGMLASGCTTGTGLITPSFISSRYSGVAPLSVFFDASDTSANTVKRPFHDLEYRWDFGDPKGSMARGAYWSSGSRPGISSRNAATGPEAAHVFEVPGVYTVSLTVTDGKNSATNSCGRIVVKDPDIAFAGTDTICVGATNAPVPGKNGCPAGALAAKQSSFPAAISSYARTGKRILLQRGDTFTAATPASLTQTGPGILAAFGVGSAPRVTMTGNTQILVLSSRETPAIKDWRIMDLEFDGQSKSESVGIDTAGGIDQVLILNMNMHDVHVGIVFVDDILSAWYLGSGLTRHTMFDEISIVDSTITPILNSTSGWRIYASATRASIQGNTLGNMISERSTGSHVLRIPYMEKGVIANNTVARPGENQLAIKLHSQGWCESTSPRGKCTRYDNEAPPPIYTYRSNTHPIGIFSTLSGYTEKVVISDNKLIGADNPYTMSIASQNRQSDERLRDIIVERNWFISGKGTQLALYVVSSDTTIRNNIFDMTEGKYKTFINLAPPGTSPPSANVRVYNNTFYGGSAPAISGNEFTGISVDPTSANIAAANNLIYAPSATNPLIISGNAVGLVSSNNSTAGQLRTFPGWISSAPRTPSDFRLKANSYAAGSGQPVPVFSDFFLRSQPPYNIGATGQPH